MHTRVLLEHEPVPLTIADASGTAEVRPRRDHDALPSIALEELDPDRLPEPLAAALRDAGFDEPLASTLREASFGDAPAGEASIDVSAAGTPPAPFLQLWYEEASVAPGERLYAVGRVTRAGTPSEGGAYRGRSTPTHIDDAVLSLDSPAGLARPYRSRGVMLLLGGLALGSLGAATLAAALRAIP